MENRFRRLLRILSLAFALGSAACSDRPTALSDPISVTLTVVSGNTQSGVVGQELSAPLVVKATNPNGSALANLAVDFKVTSGGGSMYVVATTTNSKGLAQNYWTLGTSTAVAQTVEVRSILSTGAKQVLGTFAAKPLAGPPSQIVGRSGYGQVQVLLKGTPVPVPPSVFVSDLYGNPVPNRSVAFAVVSGGGSVTSASPLTNATGVATIGSWTVGLARGPNALTATATGSGITGNPLTFAATASDWGSLTPMPTPRATMGAGVVNGVLYAMGGNPITTPTAKPSRAPGIGAFALQLLVTGS